MDTKKELVDTELVENHHFSNGCNISSLEDVKNILQSVYNANSNVSLVEVRQAVKNLRLCFL